MPPAAGMPALKEDAVEKTLPVNATVGRFMPDDQLLSFLRNLCCRGFEATVPKVKEAAYSNRKATFGSTLAALRLGK